MRCFPHPSFADANATFSRAREKEEVPFLFLLPTAFECGAQSATGEVFLLHAPLLARFLLPKIP
jgi:hypothetical protein